MYAAVPAKVIRCGLFCVLVRPLFCESLKVRVLAENGGVFGEVAPFDLGAVLLHGIAAVRVDEHELAAVDATYQIGAHKHFAGRLVYFKADPVDRAVPAVACLYPSIGSGEVESLVELVNGVHQATCLAVPGGLRWV